MSSITDIINKHAPLTTRKIPIRQSFPWYSIDTKIAKQVRRKAKRRWKQTGLTIHRDIFKYLRRKVKELIAKAKAKYYQDAIIECSDSKSLFRVMDHLLKRKSEPKLPSFTSAEDLLNRFANFFSDKITNIRTVILEKQKQDDYDYEPPSVNKPNLISFETFCPVTVGEICKTIMCCPTTSCVLDLLPTQLLKTNVDILSPVIPRLVNLSLTTGKFPSSQKSAIITPLLKKASLNPESLKNYRPVSNLTFVSKLLERMVAKQLHEHRSKHQLYEKHQSAYRKRHSTETALTRVQNDILRAMDDSKATVLVLLDLSAPFDTVDYNLERLKQCGISGTAQSWFKSYLKDRSQKVHLHGSSSASSSLRFGVPQGSVLGPILFTIYTIPLGEICRLHVVQYHLYADDTQLYVSFKVDDAVDLLEAQRRIEMCIAEIKAGMVMFMLKLNNDKTELVIIAPPYFLHHNKVPLSSVQVGDSGILTSKSTRNIGVMFDHHMDMTTQVTKMCQAA